MSRRQRRRIKAVSEKAQTREGVSQRLLLAALELKAARYEQAERLYRTPIWRRATIRETCVCAPISGWAEVAEAQGQPDRAARHYLSVAVLYDDPEWTPHSLFRAGEMLGQAGKMNRRPRGRNCASVILNPALRDRSEAANRECRVEHSRLRGNLHPLPAPFADKEMLSSRLRFTPEGYLR